MPIVTISAKPEWCPVGATMDELSVNQLVIVDLCANMPVLVAEVLGEQGFSTRPREVFVDIAMISRWARNAAPLWVKVVPMWTPAIEAARASILRSLRMDIYAHLSLHLPNIGKCPEFDADVMFDHGIGCHLDQHGEVSDQWASDLPVTT